MAPGPSKDQVQDYRNQNAADGPIDTLKPHPTDQGGKKLRDWYKDHPPAEGTKENR